MAPGHRRFTRNLANGTEEGITQAL